MNPLACARRSLGLKLFLSYLVVVLVGVGVLVMAAQGVAPTAFSRHMAGMMNPDMPMPSSPTMQALFGDFRDALTEAVALAAGASLLASLGVAYFVSRRVLGPVSEMMTASRAMVSGRYSHRVRSASADELGTLAQNFNAMAEALEQTEDRRQRLIADVAHEFRTPLSTIRSYVEGLEDGVAPATPATYGLINREVERLTRLVADLQDLSRVEARQINLRPRPIDASALVDAAKGRLGPQYQTKGVALETEVAESVGRVQADEDRVIQVLLNLLGNALQYTPSGGHVRVTAARQGAEVCFAVQDTGIGVSAEHLPHLFERFYRVDRSRSRAGGGTGIGLTIAKLIVEAHGGRIWAESGGPGSGAAFSFTLPRAAE